MAYTAEQMAAHAELHYYEANKALTAAREPDGTYIPSVTVDWMLAHAQAQSQAGLLAMKLAEYALRPMGD